MDEVVSKIKEKKEFSELPDSIVRRACLQSNKDVKETRKFLRKYFGVFLTNKVLKGKGTFEEMLKFHISSKKRDYATFYSKIFENEKDILSVIDLGAGANGFSYSYLKEVLGDIQYLGLEASGQLVILTNKYFLQEKFNAKTVGGDLFEIKPFLKTMKQQPKKRVVLLLQVVDALENLEKNYSKKFIEEIFNESEILVITLPTESLGGRKKFGVMRKWLIDFLEEKFRIKKDFEMNGERILVVVKN